MKRSHVGLAVVTAAHAAFQLVVTGHAYPALARGPDDRWDAEHAAHSRRVVPVVGLLYGGLLGTGLAALATPPRPPWAVGSVAAAAGSVLTTALVAAPLHTRLGRRRTDRDLRALLAADRVRSAFAGAAALLAVAGTAAGQRHSRA